MNPSNPDSDQMTREEINAELARQSEELHRELLTVQSEWLRLTPFAALAKVNKSTVIAWEIDQRIFAVEFEGVRYYPVFALDDHGLPLPCVHDVIAIFRDAGMPAWDIAFWMISVNGWLGGPRPADQLAENCAAVLYAAQAGVQPVEHG